jgi:hypothetical protein
MNAASIHAMFRARPVTGVRSVGGSEVTGVGVRGMGVPSGITMELLSGTSQEQGISRMLLHIDKLVGRGSVGELIGQVRDFSRAGEVQSNRIEI